MTGYDPGYCYRHRLHYVDLDFMWNGTSSILALSSLFLGQVVTCGDIFGIRHATGSPHHSLSLILSSANPHFWLCPNYVIFTLTLFVLPAGLLGY